MVGCWTTRQTPGGCSIFNNRHIVTIYIYVVTICLLGGKIKFQ